MQSLIIKDILIQKKAFILSSGYSLFILIAFQNQVLAGTSYIMGAMAITYFLLIGACAYEEKNKSEIVLNSLPLTREEIVRARYLSVIVFVAFSLLVTGGMGALMKVMGLPFPLNYISGKDILGVLTSTVLLVSLYLPIFFKYGYFKARYFNIFLFLFFFFVPNLLVQYFREYRTREDAEELIKFIAGVPDTAFVLGLSGALMVLMVVSYLVSVGVYRRREFV